MQRLSLEELKSKSSLVTKLETIKGGCVEEISCHVKDSRAVSEGGTSIRITPDNYRQILGN